MISSPRGAAALVVIATALVSGIAAASASATNAPEYTPTPNQYHLEGGATKFANGINPNLTCEHVKGTMTLKNFWGWTDTLRFTGCKADSIAKCSSEGAQAGEIDTSQSSLPLVYLSQTNQKEVGVIFNYNPESIEPLTWFTVKCGGKTFTDTVRGSVIAKLTPADALTLAFALDLGTSGEKQELTEYESLSNSSEMLKAGLEVQNNNEHYNPTTATISSLEIQMASPGEIVTQ